MHEVKCSVKFIMDVRDCRGGVGGEMVFAGTNENLKKTRDEAWSVWMTVIISRSPTRKKISFSVREIR